MKKYITLFRVKHWFKNVLILAPLFFDMHILNRALLFRTALAMLAFSLMTSFIYITNDLHDIEKDRMHPVKCKRPLPAGLISQKTAVLLSGGVLFVSIVILSCFVRPENPLQAYGSFALYIILNLYYSVAGGKDKPIVDILILSMGFMLRLIFGAGITGIVISSWLYLVVLSGAFYLSLGKRRNELKYGKTRTVLRFYSFEFLDKNMYMILAVMIVFYALWCNGYPQKGMYLIWTVPLIILIFMRYSLIIENQESEADPMEVLLKDKALIAMAAGFIGILFMILYL